MLNRFTIQLLLNIYCLTYTFHRHYQPFESAVTATGNDSSVLSTSVYPNAQYAGGMYTQSSGDSKYYGDNSEGNEFENEPPLLEGEFCDLSILTKNRTLYKYDSIFVFFLVSLVNLNFQKLIYLTPT